MILQSSLTSTSPTTGLHTSVQPHTLRNSIHSLIASLKSSTPIDVKKSVLEDMEKILNDDENDILHKMLLPMLLVPESTTAGSASTSTSSTPPQAQPPAPPQPTQTSLIKTLLRVAELQPTLLAALLEKLPTYDYDSNSNSNNDDLNSDIPRLILSQIRWLDNITDPSSLTETVLECLQVCGHRLKLELISIIGDITPDSDTERVAEALRDVKDTDETLLLPVLDAISSLRLSSKSLSFIITDALDAINSADPSSIPAIVTFLMNNSSHDNSFSFKIMTTLREKLHLDDSPDNANASALTLEAIAQGMQVSLRHRITDPQIKIHQPSLSLLCSILLCSYPPLPHYLHSTATT